MNKAQIVYYLSHSGRLEQPHLIEVEQHSSSSLRLRDVKKRLMQLRGKDMPDAFSWAYKRSYKNDFIWSDVSDDDAILPLVGQDYVLKGSENAYGNSKVSGSRSRKSSEGLRASVDSLNSPSPFKSHAEQLAASEIYEHRHSPLSSHRSKSPRDSDHGIALRVNRRLMESLTQAKSYRGAAAAECIADDLASNNAPSEESSSTQNVKVYNTPASPVTADHGRDAATQTDDDHSRRNGPDDDIRFQAVEQQASQVECDEVHSPVALRPTKQPEESFRSKAVALRQLLSCSDTNTYPSVNRMPAEPPTKSRTTYSPLQSVYSSRSSPTCFVKGSFHGNEDPEFMPEVVKETSSDSAPAKQYIIRGESNSNFFKSREIQIFVSPPKKERRCNDDRPLTPGRTRLDWEKNLHEAVKTGAPPADFGHILQACTHCGRTFKPESLKIHMRGCRSHGAKNTSPSQTTGATSPARTRGRAATGKRAQ